VKVASGALQTFLASNKQFAMADLYTFTLPGGVVLRYSSTGTIITYSGQTYIVGPRLVSSGFSQKRGVSVSSITIVASADACHTVNGVPFLSFARGRGLDGAVLNITRVFAADWASAWVGGITRFLGKLSEIPDSGTTSVTLVCAAATDVLNQNMPTDLYGNSCKNSLFDTNCGIARASFQTSGAVAAGTITVGAFPSNLTPALSYYNLGTMLFTSGANNGQRRTVRTQDASGNFTFVAPFPSAPAAADTFNVFPTCDLSQARCSGFFNNLAKFRGEPYIPLPETIMGGVGQTNSASTNMRMYGVPGGTRGNRGDMV
jgi:uncharacterized phage protein (TIGR02218 family)